MKKAFRNFLILGIAIICLGLFAGCHKEEKKEEKLEEKPFDNVYNAVLYDRAEALMRHEFLINHLTFNSDYGGLRGDNSCPHFYSFPITDQAAFDEAFAEFPTPLDFNKEMLAIYLFTDIYNGFSCSLEETKLENDTLEIKIWHKTAAPGPNGCVPPSTSSPKLRCLTVKMDKIEASEVNFNLRYDYR